MRPAPTEQEQFRLFKADNVDAHHYFYMRHHTGIYNYFWVLGADGDAAKELTQTVFKRLWDLRSKFETVPDVATYLYVKARLLFLDQLTSRIFGGPRYSAGLELDGDSELEVVCLRVVLEMKAAIKALSRRRRLVMQLVYIKELDVHTIAQLLGLSPQTVRNTKAQATAFLRKRLCYPDLVMPNVLNIFLRYLEEQ